MRDPGAKACARGWGGARCLVSCAGLLTVVLGLIGAAAVTVLRIAKALPGCEDPPREVSHVCFCLKEQAGVEGLWLATWCCVAAATAENFGPSALCW